MTSEKFMPSFAAPACSEISMSDQDLNRIRSAFHASGISIADWADAHGFRRQNVYAVLSGRSKGRRGEAHQIARALGLKSAPTSEVVSLLATPHAGRPRSKEDLQ